MSSRMYNVSTTQNIGIKYEWYKPVCQTDTKVGRLLSSRSTRDRVNLGLGVLGMVISEADPTQLSFCLAYMGRQIPVSQYSFAMFKKMYLLSFLLRIKVLKS